MAGAPEPPNESEDEGSSALLSATESAWSRLGSEAEVTAESAIEEAALEAREEPAGAEAEGEEGRGASGEEAEAAAETQEEQEQPEQTAGDEAEAQPLAEGEAEDAEAGAEEGEEGEGEEEEEEEAAETREQELAVEEKEKKEETEGEEEEEEEEEPAAAAADQLRREQSLTRGASLRDVAEDSQAVAARKAMPGDEELGGGEEAGEEGADRLAPLAPVQKLLPDAELQELDRAPPPPPSAEGAPWSQETQKEQEEQLRAELVHQYNTLMAERSRYQRYNLFLQHKISEALRKKKGQDVAEAATDRVAEPESPEKEQAYLGYVAMLEDLRKQQADDLAWYHQELQQLQQRCRYAVEHAEKDWRKFQALKKQVVLQAMGSGRMTGGRQEVLRQVEQIQALEDKKEKEMSAVRLENVQLKQCLVHFDTRMRAQEDLTQGLHLIDFEQLKIENQTFNEKVEERNEELLKLRGKVGNNVQILTHVKEKLHFVESENLTKKAQLQEMEAQVALRRDILTKTKQARDSLRLDNIRLNQRCGLLGKHALLQDLEDKVEKTRLLTERLESLKQHHASLTLTCRGMKQKIREAKSFVPS